MDMRLVTRTKLTENGCLEWQGTKTVKGYGQITVDGKTLRVHRYAWILRNGPLHEKIFVCHSCDNPSCCNLDHLFIGTNSDNMLDCASKGRLHTCRGELNASAKIKEEDARLIRLLYASGNTYQSIADLYDLSREGVKAICRGKYWKHV